MSMSRLPAGTIRMAPAGKLAGFETLLRLDSWFLQTTTLASRHDTSAWGKASARKRLGVNRCLAGAMRNGKSRVNLRGRRVVGRALRLRFGLRSELAAGAIVAIPRLASRTGTSLRSGGMRVSIHSERRLTRTLL